MQILLIFYLTLSLEAMTVLEKQVLHDCPILTLPWVPISVPFVDQTASNSESIQPFFYSYLEKLKSNQIF